MQTPTDIEKLYQVETKRINEVPKNNPDKFPESYNFRIIEEEYNSLKSKFSTSKGSSRKGYTVFTEQGITKLYQVETRRMNEVIKRDINRFPNSFCFQLTNEEIDESSSRSQFATLK